MNYSKKLTIIGAVCFVAGVSGLAPGAYYWHRDQRLKTAVLPAPVQAQPQEADVDPEEEVISGKPVRLSVPSLAIDLEVADGFYDQSTRMWTLSNDKAHFADISVWSNDSQGNTFIYGHYRPEVFASLHNAQSGAKATILTHNGYKFVYQFRTSRITDPSDASLFTYRGDPILTLQTCTGAWMQNRQLFTFDLLKVEDS